MSYRHEAAIEHTAALENLLTALTVDLTEFAAQLGRTGEDPILVFTGAVPDGFDPSDIDLDITDADYSTFCETLGTLTVADSTGKTILTKSNLEAWPEAVDLWGMLRNALGQRFSIDLGPGIAVDPKTACAASWGPLYCPDEGAQPDLVMSFSPEDHDDPFSQLLTDSEANLEVCENRIADLMIRYELDEPTTEAHPAGACG
jgi:hypothetical protein